MSHLTPVLIRVDSNIIGKQTLCKSLSCLQRLTLLIIESEDLCYVMGEQQRHLLLTVHLITLTFYLLIGVISFLFMVFPLWSAISGLFSGGHHLHLYLFCFFWDWIRFPKAAKIKSPTCQRGLGLGLERDTIAERHILC